MPSLMSRLSDASPLLGLAHEVTLAIDRVANPSGTALSIAKARKAFAQAEGVVGRQFMSRRAVSLRQFGRATTFRGSAANPIDLVGDSLQVLGIHACAVRAVAQLEAGGVPSVAKVINRVALRYRPVEQFVRNPMGTKHFPSQGRLDLTVSSVERSTPRPAIILSSNLGVFVEDGHNPVVYHRANITSSERKGGVRVKLHVVTDVDGVDEKVEEWESPTATWITEPSGALVVFRRPNDQWAAYAPGQWLKVREVADGSQD